MNGLRSALPGRSLAAIVAGIVMAAAPVAEAQFGLGGIGQSFRPAFTNRDVQLATDMLNLDEAQQFILETFYEDYRLEFQTGVDAFRERLVSMRSEVDPNNPDRNKIVAMVFGRLGEWQEESRQLADQFMTDLKGLLNEEQLGQWPAFERRLYRLKHLGEGRLPGESLDLTNEIRDLELSREARQEIAPLLEEYEKQLDDALRQRDERMQSTQSDLIAALQESNYDYTIEATKRQLELRKAVRDVNEHYTGLLAAALPEEAGEELVRSVRERTYPRIFRVTPAERVFKAALELEELSEETREAIASLQRDFKAELAAFNETLVQVAREFEPKKVTHKVERAAARLAGREPQRLDDPMREKFAERRELGARYVDLLKALLTPEQFAELPGARRYGDDRELEDDERAVTGKQFNKRAAARRALIKREAGESTPNVVGDKPQGGGSTSGGKGDDKEGKKSDD